MVREPPKLRSYSGRNGCSILGREFQRRIERHRAMYAKKCLVASIALLILCIGFKVLSEAERTAALYSLLQHSTQVQIRFFITVLQQMARADPMTALLSPAMGG